MMARIGGLGADKRLRVVVVNLDVVRGIAPRKKLADLARIFHEQLDPPKFSAKWS